jgi:hypothetical protein
MLEQASQNKKDEDSDPKPRETTSADEKDA